MSRRLFVAVLPDDEARHRIAAALDGAGVPGRLVPPSEWHLTLRFIGSLDQLTTERLLHSLETEPFGPAFDVAWGGLGAFPRPTKATVVWVGVSQGVDELGLLADRVEGAVSASGVAPEDRPFRSHLTVSRVRPPQDASTLIETVPSVGGRTRVSAVHLMESRLERPRGDRYRIVATYPLN